MALDVCAVALLTALERAHGGEKSGRHLSDSGWSVQERRTREGGYARQAVSTSKVVRSDGTVVVATRCP